MKTRILIILVMFGLLFSNGNTNASDNTFKSGDVMNVNIMPWSYTNTGTNHTIFYQIETISINNQFISIGDYIGVFYDQGGVLVCGGYSAYDGTNGAVAAWGALSGVDNGFQSGEQFSWKIWRASDGAIFDMGATYHPVGAWFTHAGYFASNGMSGILLMTDQIPPSVSFTGLGGPYCDSDGFVTLTGSPTGGVFTGSGMSGNDFYPALAGPGTHNITYSYTNTGGLSNSETQTVIVYQTPTVDLGPDQNLCAPQGLLLDAGANLNYIWSTGETTQTISVIASGLYSVTVTEGSSCTDSDEISITVYPETTVSFTGLLSNYCAGNSTSLLIGSPSGGVFSGSGITVDTFDPAVAGNGVHQISYTYVDVNGCVVVDYQTTTVGVGNTINLGPDQSFCADQNTTLDAGQFDTYLWSDGSTTQTIDVSISGTYSVTANDASGCSSEDEILITVMDLPQSGLSPLYTLIPGQTIQLAASTGFASYLWNDGTTDESVATSYPGEFYVTIEGANGCVSTDTVDVEFDLDAVHIINVPQGWSYVSTYVDPYLPSITDVFSPIVNELIIAKNGSGQVYWPAFFLNLIGNHVVGQGYQVKTTLAVILPISGTMIVPEWNPIIIPQGWSILGYLRYVPGDLVEIIAPIVSDLVIIKNGAGQFYWPAFGLNLIGDFTPGEGYLLLLNQSRSFLYPWNGSLTKSGFINSPGTVHYPTIDKLSGANMSVVIPESAWSVFPVIGDEIAIKNSKGIICGSTVYDGNNTGITVWGDDLYTDDVEFLAEKEVFYLELWNKANGTESIIDVVEWESGDYNYNTDGLTIVRKIGENDISGQIITNCYPNPFNHSSVINFSVNKDQNIKITVINGNGEIISALYNEFTTKGDYKVSFESKGISSGVYYYQLLTDNDVITKALIKL